MSKRRTINSGSLSNYNDLFIVLFGSNFISLEGIKSTIKDSIYKKVIVTLRGVESDYEQINIQHLLNALPRIEFQYKEGVFLQEETIISPIINGELVDVLLTEKSAKKSQNYYKGISPSFINRILNCIFGFDKKQIEYIKNEQNEIDAISIFIPSNDYANSKGFAINYERLKYIGINTIEVLIPMYKGPNILVP